jgi:energy-converting hydrogenase Eha subunit A
MFVLSANPLGSIALKQVVSICKMPINPREPPSKFGFTVLEYVPVVVLVAGCGSHLIRVLPFLQQ